MSETNAERYERQARLFGAVGQRRIEDARVGVIGLGGLGSHVIQQLAYLGVRSYVLIDNDLVSLSNLNRLVGAEPDDVEQQAAKVAIAERSIARIQPKSRTRPVKADLTQQIAAAELTSVDIAFGCVDNDGARLRLTEHAAMRNLPYIDLATDIDPEADWYGGRVVFAKDGERCLFCLGELDQHELARASMSEEQRLADDRMYGIDRAALEGTGPAVVSINGVVASLAVTEFMAWITGLREPIGHLVYRGEQGVVRVNRDEPAPDCYFCKTLRAQAAD